MGGGVRVEGGVGVGGVGVGMEEVEEEFDTKRWTGGNRVLLILLLKC